MTVIITDKAPAAIGPYVQGVAISGKNEIVITSGQLPAEPTTGLIPADIAAQTRQSLENVRAIVEAAGLCMNNIVKTTVYVKDLNAFPVINEIYEAYFSEHNAGFPARSCVEIARLPKDALVEIEAIAFRQN